MRRGGALRACANIFPPVPSADISLELNFVDHVSNRKHFLGVKSFNLQLSGRATFGRWKLQVEVDSTDFSVEIDVSAIGSGSGFPDIAAAEEHYVELRFGREMRRSYKPGLPFIGKVKFRRLVFIKFHSCPLTGRGNEH